MIENCRAALSLRYLWGAGEPSLGIIHRRNQAADADQLGPEPLSIELRLAQLLAAKRMSLTALSERVHVTPVNLSVLKSGRAKAMRFSTLNAICRALKCQPGDLLVYRAEPTRRTSARLPAERQLAASKRDRNG